MFKGVVLSQLAALGGSVFFIFYQKGGADIAVGQAAYIIFVFACFFNSLISGHHFVGYQWRALSKKCWLLLLVVSVAALVGNMAAASALKELPPSSVHLVQRAETIFSILIGIYFLKEGNLKTFILSMLLFGLGVYFLYAHDKQTSDAAVSLQPYFMGIVSAVAFAIMQSATRILLGEMSAALVNNIRLLVAVVAISAVQPDYIFMAMAMPLEQLGYLLVGAVAGPFLARIAYMKAAYHVGVATAALLASTSPVMTLAIQTVFLGLAVSDYQLLGSAILLVAVSLPVVIYYFVAKRNRQRQDYKDKTTLPSSTLTG